MNDVTELADELTRIMFDKEPLWPALLGISSERAGLGDLSEAAEQDYRAALADIIARADAIDPAGLPRTDRRTREVVRSQARGAIDQIDSHALEFTITDMFVAPASELLTLLPMVSVADEQQGREQLGRLAAIPGYLEQALRRHRAGVAAGRVPVAHLVRAAIDHIDRYLAAPSDDPLLRRPGPDEEFDKERARLLADVVHPAFLAYRDGLATDIEPHGRSADRPGLCWLPDGERIYRLLARAHTTTDRGPQELHDIGLRLIDQLADEYREIGQRVWGLRELGEIFTKLRTDPQLRWSSAGELLESARAAILRAEEQAPAWFGDIPPQSCVVEPVPPAEAPGGAPAYYVPPAVDGSRPGTYFANTHQVTERFRQTSEVTAFHEAIPGHHFQLSTAMGLRELPLLRQIGGFNAYTEGWGLYCERLAAEMGLYSDDVSLLGMLSMDSMRAGRLVVDTGLHAKGWSRQQAVDYLAENTPMPQVEIDSEVDRYIAYPGQALAYMVGRLEIQRIRAAAQAELGANFDIRGFHDVVLGGGAVPLSVLDSAVSEWVTDNA